MLPYDTFYAICRVTSSLAGLREQLDDAVSIGDYPDNSDIDALRQLKIGLDAATAAIKRAEDPRSSNVSRASSSPRQ